MAAKRRVRVKVNKRFYVFAALAVAAVFVVQFVKVDNKLMQQQEQIASLDAQILQAQEYNDSLRAKIDSADSLENIEKIARETLGWVREDEIVFVAKNVDDGVQP